MDETPAFTRRRKRYSNDGHGHGHGNGQDDSDGDGDAMVLTQGCAIEWDEEQEEDTPYGTKHLNLSSLFQSPDAATTPGSTFTSKSSSQKKTSRSRSRSRNGKISASWSGGEKSEDTSPKPFFFGTQPSTTTCSDGTGMGMGMGNSPSPIVDTKGKEKQMEQEIDYIYSVLEQSNKNNASSQLHGGKDGDGDGKSNGNNPKMSGNDKGSQTPKKNNRSGGEKMGSASGSTSALASGRRNLNANDFNAMLSNLTGTGHRQQQVAATAVAGAKNRRRRREMEERKRLRRQQLQTQIQSRSRSRSDSSTGSGKRRRTSTSTSISTTSAAEKQKNRGEATLDSVSSGTSILDDLLTELKESSTGASCSMESSPGGGSESSGSSSSPSPSPSDNDNYIGRDQGGFQYDISTSESPIRTTGIGSNAMKCHNPTTQSSGTMMERGRKLKSSEGQPEEISRNPPLDAAGHSNAKKPASSTIDNNDDMFDEEITFDDDMFAAIDEAVRNRQSQKSVASESISASVSASASQSQPTHTMSASATSRNRSLNESFESEALLAFQRSPTLPTSNKSADAGERQRQRQRQRDGDASGTAARPCVANEEKKLDDVARSQRVGRNNEVRAETSSHIPRRGRETDGTRLQAPSPKPEREPEHTTIPENDAIDDDFDDFGMINFDEIDKQIAERKPKVQTPSSSLPLQIKYPDARYITSSRYIIRFVHENNRDGIKTLQVAVWKSSFDDESSTITTSTPHDGSCGKAVDEIEIDGEIHVHDEWFHIRYEPGDVIHICSISGRYQTDCLPITLRTSGVDDDLVLILRPDSLITPTAISDTVGCLRRAVLKSRYGSSGLTSKSALMGQMRHDLFEKCLLQNTFTRDFVYKEAPRVVRNHADQLIGAGLVNEKQNIADVARILSNIQRFACKHTSFTKNRARRILEGYSTSPSVEMIADGVHGTEELTTSTELGIKGYVDATIEVSSLPDNGIVNHMQQRSPVKSLMGVELKTGHNQTPQQAHLAQLSLYTLTLRTRYGSMPPSSTISAPVSKNPGSANGGILLYLNNEGMKAFHVAPHINEIKSLLNQRNVLATELKKASMPRGVVVEYDKETDNRKTTVLPATPVALPELLPSSSQCERCYMNRECMLNAAVEHITFNDDEKIRSHNTLLRHFTGHLDHIEIQYLKEWDRLIDLEDSSSKHEITKAWLIPSSRREISTGNTISSLVIDDSSIEERTEETSEIIIKLFRSSCSLISTPLNDLKFEAGSRVVLSTDGTSTSQTSNSGRKRTKHIFSLSKAKIHAIEGLFVSILVSQSDFRRICSMVKIESSPKAADTLKFRLDKDDFVGGSSTLRQNLVRLFTADILPFSTKSDRSQETLTNVQQRLRSRAPSMRRAVVHLDPPRFDSISSDDLFGVPSTSSLGPEFSKLNKDQQEAVIKVMSARDYSIIQGFPGTGKTSTIVFIVRLMIALGKRVLVTSYTHAAVDNILLKLIDHDVGMRQGRSINTDLVRIGPKSACHPLLHRVLASELAGEMDRHDFLQGDTIPQCADDMEPSVSSLNQVICSAKIVGVSALTMPRTPLLIGQDFDVVIVDEAGQINQPACIGAIMGAASFLLVGDHEQLPPLVQNDAAKEAGYGISLLKRLAESHPHSVAQLTLQYRMHQDICRLPNLLVYGGNLKCANDIVSKKKLELPQFPRSLRSIIKPGRSGLGWLLPVLNPNRPVVFVNTDMIGQGESSDFQGHEISQGRGSDGGGVVNDVEVCLAGYIIYGLQICGLDLSRIGIISPYRAQVARLGDDPYLRSSKTSGLEINTIDRYQGRDKDAILISLVRSNKSGKTGRLLEDKSRLNVALSRAKTKLILIGSYKTLSNGSSIMSRALEVMKGKKSVDLLPAIALDVYRKPVQ